MEVPFGCPDGLEPVGVRPAGALQEQAISVACMLATSGEVEQAQRRGATAWCDRRREPTAPLQDDVEAPGEGPQQLQDRDVERQARDREPHAGRVVVDDRVHTHEEVRDLGVLDLNAFRPPGRTRRIDDVGEIIGAMSDGDRRRPCRVGDVRRESNHLHVGAEVPGRGGTDHHRCARVGDHELRSRGRVLGVERQVCSAGAENGEHGDDQIGVATECEADDVPSFDARRPQVRRQPIDSGAELAIRERRGPARQCGEVAPGSDTSTEQPVDGHGPVMVHVVAVEAFDDRVIGLGYRVDVGEHGVRVVGERRDHVSEPSRELPEFNGIDAPCEGHQPRVVDVNGHTVRVVGQIGTTRQDGDSGGCGVQVGVSPDQIGEERPVSDRGVDRFADLRHGCGHGGPGIDGGHHPRGAEQRSQSPDQRSRRLVGDIDRDRAVVAVSTHGEGRSGDHHRTVRSEPHQGLDDSRRGRHRQRWERCVRRSSELLSPPRLLIAEGGIEFREGRSKLGRCVHERRLRRGRVAIRIADDTHDEIPVDRREPESTGLRRCECSCRCGRVAFQANIADDEHTILDDETRSADDVHDPVTQFETADVAGVLLR